MANIDYGCIIINEEIDAKDSDKNKKHLAFNSVGPFLSKQWTVIWLIYHSKSMLLENLYPSLNLVDRSYHFI